MEGRVNPSGVRYHDGAIPLATPAKSAIRKFYPSNGRDFSPEGVKVIQLPLSAEGMFLDASGHSFLKFDLHAKGQSGADSKDNNADYKMGGGGAHGWIKRLRLLSATGQQLEDIDDYNALHSLMIDMQCSPNYCDTVLRSRSGYGRQTAGGEITATVGNSKALLVGTPVKYVGSGAGGSDTGTVAVASGDLDQVAATGFTFSAAMIDCFITIGSETRKISSVAATGATLQVSAAFPAGGIASTNNFQIRGVTTNTTRTADNPDSVTFSSSGLEVAGETIDKSAGLKRTYSINLLSGLLSQPKYLPLLATKGGIQIELTLEDPAVFLTKAVAGEAIATTDSYELKNVEYVAELVDFGPDFNARFMQMLMSTGGVLLSGSTYRNHTGTFTNSANQNISISERSRSIKSIFTILRDKAVYGNRNYESVNDRTRGQVEEYQYRVGSLVYPDHKVRIDERNSGEGVSQAYKALGGALTDVHHGSCLTAKSFVRGMGSDGVDDQLPAPDMITNADDKGKCVFAMTFESTTQDSAFLESGLNSAAQALPIEFRADGPRVVTNSDDSAASFRVNSYVLVDAIFSFLPNGEVSASV